MSSSPPAARKPALRWIKLAVQLTVFGAVVWGVWKTVDDAGAKFAAAGFSPRNLSLPWLLAAGGFYIAGMLPSFLFWQRTLETMQQRPEFWTTLKAFFIGHLGKYVPGKALVVILRTGLVRGPQVDLAVAAASVFVETLTMMAVGATVSALIMALHFRQHQLLLLLAILLAAVAGIPTWPPLFRRIVGWLQVRRASPAIEQAVQKLNYSLMAYGWVTITVGWVLLGLSLWATIRAIPAAPPSGPSEHLALLTACVALAMVAGFLSLLPGGVGVRELVVMTLLAPQFGDVVAIVSAVTLRIVWLLAELVVAGALLIGVRKRD